MKRRRFSSEDLSFIASRQTPGVQTARRLIERMRVRLGREPTDEELALTMARSIKRIRAYREKM